MSLPECFQPNMKITDFTIVIIVKARFKRLFAWKWKEIRWSVHSSRFAITIVFVDTRLWKTKHVPGLKVNDQLVAVFGFGLKNHVWSHHRVLKAKVQCDFSSAYSPDHSNVLRLIKIFYIRNNITRHKIRKSHHSSFIGVCSIHHL